MVAQPAFVAIAIAGGSGSGKTTLARALGDALGERCAVLDHDSYYRDLSHLPAPARAAVNFDHPDALENGLLVEHLQALRSGVPIDKPRYCFHTHTRTQPAERLQPRPVVVVEGILVLSLPELRSAFDLRVFVDTPADVRALRRARRDVHERGRTIDSVLAQWLASVRPMHERFVEPARTAADLVVSGEVPVARALAQVQALLAARALPAR